MVNIFKGRLILVRMLMLLSMAALVGVGAAAIYGVGNPEGAAGGGGEISEFWKKQMIFGAIGLICFLAVNSVSYRRLGAWSYWLYGATVVLLVVLLVDKVFDLPFVPVLNNSRRWIRVGSERLSLQLQPSEFCKIAYILALGWYLRYRSNYSRFSSLVGPFVLTLVPMGLILVEPDLGTVLLMPPILFTMVFVAGAKTKHLLIIVLCAAVVSPIFWHTMQPYQRTRISCVLLQNRWVWERARSSAFLTKVLAGDRVRLNSWDRNEGYQLKHSKLAVASGGFGGNGWGQGPYLKYNFLPERHNDFIFAIIAHQWGFLGCLGVVVLYMILISCGVEIAWLNTDPFGRLVAVGIIAMFAVQVLVNVSMNLGLMPITGLTLPFVSYGGSSLVVNIMAVGILNNIGRCRPFSVAESFK